MALYDEDLADDPKTPESEVESEEEDTDESGPEDGEEESDSEEESDDSEEESEEESDDDAEEESDEDEEEEDPEPEVDLANVPVDELLKKNEKLRRTVQSARDKGAAAERKKIRDELKTQREERERQRGEEELDKILEDDDAEGLLDYIKKNRETQKADTEALRKHTAAAQKLLRENPEFAVLGEDTISELESDSTDIVDLFAKLSKARREHEIAELRKGLKDEDEEEAEATKTEKRAKKRSAKKGGSKKVSESRRSKPVKTPRSDAEYEDAYNTGDIAFTELPEHLRKKYAGG
jgi:hypothetical protein